MEFSNIKLNCIKGLPINDVPTKPLTEFVFPVDAPTPPDLLHDRSYNSAFYKLYDTPFAIVLSVEKMYIRYLLSVKDADAAFEMTLSELQKYHITADELVAELRSGCVYGLSYNDAELLYQELVYLIETLLPRQPSDIYIIPLTFSRIPHITYSLSSLPKQWASKHIPTVPSPTTVSL